MKKLNNMKPRELLSYRSRWRKKQVDYQDGSKNWLKCQRRINRATLYILNIRIDGDRS